MCKVTESSTKLCNRSTQLSTAILLFSFSLPPPSFNKRWTGRIRSPRRMRRRKRSGHGRFQIGLVAGVSRHDMRQSRHHLKHLPLSVKHGEHCRRRSCSALVRPIEEPFIDLPLVNFCNPPRRTSGIRHLKYWFTHVILRATIVDQNHLAGLLCFEDKSAPNYISNQSWSWESNVVHHRHQFGCL